MNTSIWQDRRTLITGHTGFKGAWLSLWLEKLGAQVSGYALEPQTSPSLFDLARLQESTHSTTADIRDLPRLLEVFKQQQPEVVFHLAAQSLVRPSYQDPVGTYSTNVLGTVHLLEAVRQTPGVRAVVVVTSDKCYENREWCWPYRETDPMGGHDPYSNSKGCAELVTAGYRASFFSTTAENAPVAVASARAGNVIGGGDWAEDRLLPDILRGAMAGEEIYIRAPQAIRPWQHVLEPLNGYLLLAEHLWQQGEAFAEGWNFGPAEEDARSVGWIVQRMAALWGPKMRWSQPPGEHPHEAQTLKLDSSKARTRLGWKPRLNLPQALEWVVEWTQDFRAGEDVRQITEDQIARYEDINS